MPEGGNYVTPPGVVNPLEDKQAKVQVYEGAVWLMHECRRKGEPEEVHRYRCSSYHVKRLKCPAKLLLYKEGHGKRCQGVHSPECGIAQWRKRTKMTDLCREIDALAQSGDPMKELARYTWMKKHSDQDYAELDEKSFLAWKMAMKGTGEKAQERSDPPAGPPPRNPLGREEGWMRGGWVAGGHFKYMWFMLEGAKEHLKNCKTWLVDGTFWTCPKGYQQLWNVMAFDGRTFVPCAHFLLPNQQTETFAWAMLELLNILADGGDGSDIAVKRIMTDFEKAEVNGISLAFSIFFDAAKGKEVREAVASPIPIKRIRLLAGNGLTVHPIKFSGCLFHFSQAMVRFCASRYRVGHEERGMAQRFLAFFLWLPYFDISEIIELFAQVLAKANTCTEFVTYFYYNWIFHIAWWKVNAKEDILTNGGIECFHRDLKSLFNRSHPNWGSLQDALYLFDRDRLEKNIGATNLDCTKGVGSRRAAMLHPAGKGLILGRMKEWVRLLGSAGQPSLAVSSVMASLKELPPPGVSMDDWLKIRNSEFDFRPKENACCETEESTTRNNGRRIRLKVPTSLEDNCRVYSASEIALNRIIESDMKNELSLASVNAALAEDRGTSEEQGD
jgi:hypothetical protein